MQLSRKARLDCVFCSSTRRDALTVLVLVHEALQSYVGLF